MDFAPLSQSFIRTDSKSLSRLVISKEIQYTLVNMFQLYTLTSRSIYIAVNRYDRAPGYEDYHMFASVQIHHRYASFHTLATLW
jgi:hypothetical protein